MPLIKKRPDVAKHLKHYSLGTIALFLVNIFLCTLLFLVYAERLSSLSSPSNEIEALAAVSRDLAAFKKSFTTLTHKNHYKESHDPYLRTTHCKTILKDHRSGKIPEMIMTDKNQLRGRSYATITDTPKPFYFAVHDAEIDHTRFSSFTHRHYYESHLTEAIYTTFDKKKTNGLSSIMLDVGGNIGWYSLVAAAHGAEVYTFEPNVMNAVRFCESQSLNGWVHDDTDDNEINLFLRGVGDKHGENKQLFWHKPNNDNPGAMTFVNKSEKSFSNNAIGIITLDALAEDQGWFKSKPSIGFMKVDVEGFELFVYKGAVKLLNSGIIENIAMEMNDGNDKEHRREIVKILFEAGYGLYKHGSYRGPNIEVTKKYNSFEELAEDVMGRKYRENLWFRPQ